MKPTIASRRDSASGRFYEIDNQLYPSVTTILSAISKPALIPWAANAERKATSEAAALLYEELAATTQAYPRSWYLAALESRLGQVKAHQRLLDAAGDVGTEAHKWIEWRMRLACLAEAGPEPIVRAAAAIAVRAFMEWAESVALKPVLVEKTLVSKVHGYAGTMDLVARVHGVLTAVEIKSSKSIYGEAHLQSAAYSVALEEMQYPKDMPGVIIRLPKSAGDAAFEVVTVAPAAKLFPVFLAAKSLWEWSYANERSYRRRRGAVA